MKIKPLLITMLLSIGALVGCSREEAPSSSQSSVNSSVTSSSISSSNNNPSSSSSSNSVESSIVSSSEEPFDDNDLFISEYWNICYKHGVYEVLGSNSDKALELYNPKDTPIDLSSYKIIAYGSGESTPKNDNYIINLSGTLAPKTTYVIVNSYARSELKAYGDLTTTTVYIGPKSAVGLYKNDKLIDVFGEIGKTYASANDFVINDVIAACEVHNIVRVAGKRNKVTFDETEWEVRQDTDISTLGIHEECTKNKIQRDEAASKYNEDAIAALELLVESYFNYETAIFTGDIPLYKTFEGFSFSYDFQCCSDYFDNEGKMIKEPSDKFYILIYISVLDKNGNVIKTEYFAGGTFRTMESIAKEEREIYKAALKAFVLQRFGVESEEEVYYANGDFPCEYTFIYNKGEYKIRYDFSCASDYYDADGKLINTPAVGTTFNVTVKVVDYSNENVVVDSFDVYCMYSA